MDWMEQSGLKWIEWTNMDWSSPNRSNGLKCYFDVAQHERNNNKCFTLTFRYFYIDIDIDDFEV